MPSRRRLVVSLVAAIGTPLTLATAITLAASPARADSLPTIVQSVSAAPWVAGIPIKISTVTATDGAPDAEAVVTTDATGPGGRIVQAVAAPTDINGHTSTALTLPASGSWLVKSSVTLDGHDISSAPVRMVVSRATARLIASAVNAPVSERLVTLAVQEVSNAQPAGVARGVAVVQTRRVGVGRWTAPVRVHFDVNGRALLRFAFWRTTQISLVSTATASTSAAGIVIAQTVIPSRAPVWFGRGYPQPRLEYPAGEAPFGAGAQPRVASVPASVRATMLGLSWHPGCLPYSDLRYVSINYWGFDGFRYRGHLVVEASIAGSTARVFTSLYNLRYPIRSMFLPDRYGHHPYGPGANDYASMAADNTYGFNCRYVVGKEDWGIWSPHASGRAIDINTWENPYVARTGVFPDYWWLDRSRVNAAVLRWNSPAVLAFEREGFSWGASYDDFQHFDK